MREYNSAMQILVSDKGEVLIPGTFCAVLGIRPGDLVDVTIEDGRIFVAPVPAHFELRVCPECGPVFQGNGWDGIDAHWRAKHDQIMKYEEAWPLISAEKYMSNKELPESSG